MSLLGLAVTTGILAAVGPAHAGALKLPAGPVAPTMKPLAHVEPHIAIAAANTPGDADSARGKQPPGAAEKSSDRRAVWPPWSPAATTP